LGRNKNKLQLNNLLSDPCTLLNGPRVTKVKKLVEEGAVGLMSLLLIAVLFSECYRVCLSSAEYHLVSVVLSTISGSENLSLRQLKNFCHSWFNTIIAPPSVKTLNRLSVLVQPVVSSTSSTDPVT